MHRYRAIPMALVLLCLLVLNNLAWSHETASAAPGNKPLAAAALSQLQRVSATRSLDHTSVAAGPATCLMPNIRRYLLIEGSLTIDKTMSIDMDGDGIEEIVVSSWRQTDSGDIFHFVDILSCKQDRWDNVYHQEISSGCYVKMAGAKFSRDDKVQVLVLSVCDTSEFSVFSVIGYGNGTKPEKLYPATFSSLPETYPATPAPIARQGCIPTNIKELLPEQDPVILEDIVPVDIDADGTDEIALLTTKWVEIPDMDVALKWSRFDILACEGGEWSNVYNDEFESFSCGVGIESAELTGDNRKQILETSSCGMGSYLDYSVIGVRDGPKPEVLFSESGFPEGTAWTGEGALFLYDAGTVRSYRWDGKTFVRTGEAGFLPPPGSTIVTYWLDGDKLVSDAPDDLVDLKVGQTVYFIRDRQKDSGDYSTEVHYSADGIIELSDRRFIGFRGVNRGKTTVDIQTTTGREWIVFHVSVHSR